MVCSYQRRYLRRQCWRSSGRFRRETGREVVAKRTPQKRDGVYQRKDWPGWWISWTDAQGRRRRRKTDAQNTTQAKAVRAAENGRFQNPCFGVDGRWGHRRLKTLTFRRGVW